MIQEAETFVSPAQFERLCDLVSRHCGIRLHDGKQELVRARVAKLLRGSRSQSVGDYLDGVMADPGGEDFARLIDALSTNLTSFFREPVHFAFLRDELLPGLLARKRRQRHNRIRGWSAACSTGEEPYSIAITLADALRDAGAWDVKVLATDLSRAVLRTAVLGVYDAARVDAVPPALRDRYFAPAGGADGAGRVRIDPAVRRGIAFNHLNLIDPWPFTGPFDFIFCRNVMIYFDKQTQERLVNRMWDCLEPGGVLFTGHSESLTGITHRFGYARPTIYVKS